MDAMTDFPKLTQAEFRDWLKSKDKDNVVGYRDNDYLCPVANYLKYVTGNEEILVGVESMEVYEDNEWKVYELPSWAAKFEKYICNFNHYLSSTSAVTAKEALSILNEVE